MDIHAQIIILTRIWFSSIRYNPQIELTVKTVQKFCNICWRCVGVLTVRMCLSPFVFAFFAFFLFFFVRLTNIVKIVMYVIITVEIVIVVIVVLAVIVIVVVNVVGLVRAITLVKDDLLNKVKLHNY